MPLFASGQKAQDVKNAKLYLWDITNKKLIKQLDGCTLTIVDISFSPKDNYILSVSRDRSWNLYIKNNNSYELLQNMKNAHKRIIWCCSWTFDEQFFATGSRDKFISIWKKGEDKKFKKYTNLETKEAVTAIEFIGKIFGNKENEKQVDAKVKEERLNKLASKNKTDLNGVKDSTLLSDNLELQRRREMKGEQHANRNLYSSDH